MKPGDLAIVTSLTLCYKTSRVGQSLVIRDATEDMLVPGDFAIILGQEEHSTHLFSATGSFQLSLVLAFCRHGLVALNPYSFMIFVDDNLCSFPLGNV